MIFFVMVLKSALWFFAFWTGYKSDRNGMLARAAGISVLLTILDRFSVAANLGFSAILLSLALYLLMSFVLLPIAWKVQDATVTFLCNFLGMVGAFAGVNFTMDLIRGLHPLLNK